jgi:adenylate cyclase
MKMKLGNLISGLGGRSAAPPVEATVLFANICGSTRLFEQQGDLQARQLIARALEVLAAKTLDQGGVVIKTIGDEIMSRFPTPQQAGRAACAMHRGLKDDWGLSVLNIAVRIGLHHGPILEIENNDIVSDAVNIAARMASAAKGDQIITTRETVELLPADLEAITRRLGRVWVKGKQDEMEIFEVIWHESTSLTQMASGLQEELRSLLFMRLTLDYRGNSFELAPSTQPFTIGRGERSHLMVDRDLVSRSHAVIEFRQGKFILADRSTNGTYLLLDNGSRFLVWREEFTLHDGGIICLGQAVTDNNPDLIRYQCVTG